MTPWRCVNIPPATPYTSLTGHQRRSPIKVTLGELLGDRAAAGESPRLLGREAREDPPGHYPRGRHTRAAECPTGASLAVGRTSTPDGPAVLGEQSSRATGRPAPQHGPRRDRRNRSTATLLSPTPTPSRPRTPNRSRPGRPRRRTRRHQATRRPRRRTQEPTPPGEQRLASQTNARNADLTAVPRLSL